ncbi:MAG: tRNA-dihydrouridine synthase [Bacillota bacterium]
MKLTVTYAGIEFANPLVLASATPGWDGKHLRMAAEAGAGGVVPKTIGPVVDWAAHPRCGRLALVKSGPRAIGMVNLELFTTMSRERWIESELAEAKQGGARVVASILAMPDPADTAILAQQVQDSGAADLFELNVSCPMPVSTVGMHIGRDPVLTARQVEAVKKVATIPLAVKLTPNVADMVPIAQAAEKAGADALTISNSVRAFAGVNIDTGRPVLPAMGGYTGPAIKPIVQRHLAEVAAKVKLPISAVGGIMSWRDIVEYVMLGATTVQICTAVMWGGYEKIGQLLDGLRGFMAQRGLESLDEIRGIALPYITTTEEYAKEPPKFAQVDPARCTGCELCTKLCFYDAMAMEAGVAAVNEKCDGCNLCVLWCPSQAIVLQ